MARQDGAGRDEIEDFRERLAGLTGPPQATVLLVGLNVLFFAVMVAAGAGLLRPDPAVHIRFGSNFGPLTLDGEWWRLGSAVFIHFGALHLAFNMWALWDAGRLVERLYGTGRFVVVYAVSGLAGSIASLAWNPAVNGAGASGAIFGVFGALLVYLLDRRNGVPVSLVRPMRNSAAVFVALAIAFGWIHPGIDNAAHLGGLAAGALIGALQARPLTPAARAAPDRARPWLAAGVGALLIGAGFSWLAHPSAERAAELALRRDLAAFDAANARASAAMRSLVEEARARALDEAAFADRLEREVLPLWRELVALAGHGYALPADSPLAPLPALMRRYAEARLEAARSVAGAARSRDPVLLDRAAASSAEAARRWSELEQAVAASR